MIKEMGNKVNEINVAREAVFSFVDGINEAVAEGTEAVAQLEAVIKAKTEALVLVMNLGEMQLAEAEIDSLIKDKQLILKVNNNKRTAMIAEVGDVAEAFLKAHKSASFLYGTVDNFFLAHTSIATFQEDKETLKGFASSLNGAFREVKQVLLDEGLCEIQSNGNYVTFRGIYLGQRDLITELDVYEHKIRQYVYESYKAGKLATAWF